MKPSTVSRRTGHPSLNKRIADEIAEAVSQCKRNGDQDAEDFASHIIATLDKAGFVVVEKTGWLMRLRGNYHYASCELDGARYIAIWNGPVVERVRVITTTGNPIVWQQGEPLTDLVIAIIAKSNPAQ